MSVKVTIRKSNVFLYLQDNTVEKLQKVRELFLKNSVGGNNLKLGLQLLDEVIEELKEEDSVE